MASYTKKSQWPPKPDPKLLWSEIPERPKVHDYSQAFIAWGLPYNALEKEGGSNNPKEVLVRHILQAIQLGEQSRERYLLELSERVQDYQGNPKNVYDQEIEEPVPYDKLPHQSGVTQWTTSKWAPPGKWGLSRQFHELNKNLGHWGIRRDRKYLIQEDTNNPLAEFSAWELYTIAIANSPYNPTYWIARAFQFFRDRFFDLALGDAYRAMVLTEIITDSHKRHHRIGLYNLVHDALEQHLTRAAYKEPLIMEKLTSNFGVPWFLYPLRHAISHVISLCLLELADFKDYEVHENYLPDRLVMSEEAQALFGNRKSRINDKLDQSEERPPRHIRKHEMRGGFVSGKKHPQAQSIDRSTEAFRKRLTTRYVRGCEGVDPDLLEVRATADGDLGVFASKDIAADTLILVDEPNVRGLSRSVGSPETDQAIDKYARAAQERGGVPETPPAIDPERYRCENCFRKPRENEVLWAHRHALLLKDMDSDDNDNDTITDLKKHVCSCAIKDPHIYFCWRDTEVEGGGRNVAVRGPIEPQDLERQPFDIEDGMDADIEVEITEFANGTDDPMFGTEIGGHGKWEDDISMEEDNISGRREDNMSIDSRTHFNLSKRKRQYKQKEGRKERTRLANGRYTCFHPCSQSGKCKHRCCDIGVLEPVYSSPRPSPGPRPRPSPGPRAHHTPPPPPPPPGPSEQQPREESPCDPDSDSTEYSEDERGAQCIEVARSLSHYSACGLDWRWLYEATQSHWEDHNTILSILLRDVFDMTIKEQSKRHRMYIVPSEIDAMIMLSGGEHQPERKFPFSWSGNIVVPFDILEALGIDIFRDYRFDTWTIQVVLRKLLINACPWDPHRRGDTADTFTSLPGPRTALPEVPSDTFTPSQGPRNPLQELAPDTLTPSQDPRNALQEAPPSPQPDDLRTFVVHCGFALINHGCADTANAVWGFDVDERHGGPNQPSKRGIPNMILVRTKRAVNAGEEILIQYFPDEKPSRRRWKAQRLFGEDCRCASCAAARAAGEDLNSSPSPEPSSPKPPTPEPLSPQLPTLGLSTLGPPSLGLEPSGSSTLSGYSTPRDNQL